MATSSRKSYNSISSSFRSGRVSSSKSESSPFASSTSYYSASPSSGFFSQRRATSPTRVRIHAPPPPSPSVRFTIGRSGSPSRSIAAPPCNKPVQRSTTRRTCMCSPTTHPGSFRCAFHKNNPVVNNTVSYSPNRLNMRRSAMTNSLVRINAVEGDLVRRALAALIRPSSHQQRRRSSFQLRPSRLSVMSTAEASDL